ncbi:hypothetical protein GCM10009765_48110 [Fodinicola feengrottensis]|uniref:DUF3630 family protein n=1 Tax=Fodinicola feengrottensis TaxID=435914 RepID=A0ABN2HTX2_9ACTN
MVTVGQVAWGPGEHVGGPIDRIFAALRELFPALLVTRLSVKHMSDDDNVWFLSLTRNFDVQIDSRPGGNPPFLLESDRARMSTDDLVVAVETLDLWLREEVDAAEIGK